MLKINQLNVFLLKLILNHFVNNLINLISLNIFIVEIINIIHKKKSYSKLDHYMQQNYFFQYFIKLHTKRLNNIIYYNNFSYARDYKYD